MLFRLFIESRFIPKPTVKESSGATNLELLKELGLIHGNEDNLEEVWAPVSLVPYIGLWSGMRFLAPAGSGISVSQDPVYAPIVSNAHRFFNLMPKMKCKRLLELCSGTAFADLYAARHYADEAYAFDISPRSTYFAEFNRKLNNISNAIIKEGDLYGPSKESSSTASSCILPTCRCCGRSGFSRWRQ